MRCLLLASLLSAQVVELDPRLELVGAHHVAAGGKAPAGAYGAAVKRRFAGRPAKRSKAPLMDRLDAADRLTPELSEDPRRFIPSSLDLSWLPDARRFREAERFDEFWAEARPLLEPAFERDKKRILALNAAAKVKAYTGLEYSGRYVVTLSPYVQGERMLNSVWDGEVRTMLSLPEGERPHAEYFWSERLPAALWHQLLHGTLDAAVERALPAWFQETCFGSRLQCAKEHVVRAVLARMLGPEGAKRLKKDGDQRMFPHMALLEKRLAGFEGSGQRLDDWMPKLLEAP